MIRKTLDTLTTVAVLAVCLLILVQAGQALTHPAPAAAPAAAAGADPATAPKAGDLLPKIAGLDLGQAPRTLVMAVQSSCHFCTESMPFYKTLASAAHARPGAIKLAVVAPDDATTATEYVKTHGFTPDIIATSDLGALHVAGTPTLLLTNSSGVVEKVWIGRLTSAREKEVLAAVQGS